MKKPWELLLLLVILVAAAVAVQQTSTEQSGPQLPDLASDSSRPGGGRALYLWLQSLGYHLDRLEYRDFNPDDATRVLLILAPTSPIGKEHLVTLRRWVERGGTLVIVGSDRSSFPEISFAGRPLAPSALAGILKEFDLELKPLATAKTEAVPTQPLLPRPPVRSVRVESSSYISGTANLVPYLGEAEHPVAAGLTFGRGRVYVVASTHVFSNKGLGEADNGALLLNWLPSPREGGTIVFDEVHHGRGESRSFASVLVREPWGWATLYSLAVIFLFLMLDGRRFGRPVPSLVDTRRAAVEYVISLAGLLRRGGKGDWVARHYERSLRRNLAIVCNLDPALDSNTLAAQLIDLGRLRGDVDGRDAAQLLLELGSAARTGASEGRLVRLSAEAAEIMKACGGRRR